MYSVYYRGDGEGRWLLLKDNVPDKAYSFDASLLPDGGYTLKVIASDAPSHSPGESLTAEKVSRRFEVDTTPPRVDNLTAALEGTEIHVRFRAGDSFSNVKRAEYSVDAGDWQVVEPVGQLSDSRTENYDFNVMLANANIGVEAEEQNNRKKSRTQNRAERKGGNGSNDQSGNGSHSEHVVVVRVYDRFDNMSSAKTVIGGTATVR